MGPSTISAVTFDVMMHDEALTPHTKAVQFCKLGKKLLPNMNTVVLG